MRPAVRPVRWLPLDSIQVPPGWPGRAAGPRRARNPAARCRSRCPGPRRAFDAPADVVEEERDSGWVVDGSVREHVSRPDADDAAPGAFADQRPQLHQLEGVREDVAVRASQLVGQAHHGPAGDSPGYGFGDDQRGKSSPTRFRASFSRSRPETWPPPLTRTSTISASRSYSTRNAR